MKQITFLLLTAAFLTACNKPDDEEPGNGPLTASFTIANPGAITAGCTEVSFSNTSQNADSYAWDFGDGNTSTAENPVHVYANPGTFSVILTANKGSEVKTSSVAVTVNNFDRWDYTSDQTIGKPKMVRTNDGGFVVTNIELSAPGYREARVEKFSADGSPVWTRVLGGAGTYTRDVTLAPDGSLLVCGYTSENTSDGNWDPIIWKINPAGSILWQRQINEPFSQSFNSIVAFQDGGFWAAGETYYLGVVRLGYVAGFDANGNVIFTQNTGGTGNASTSVDMVESSDGNVVICGWGDKSSASGGDGTYDIWINQLNRSTRSLMWSKMHGSNGQFEYPEAIIRTRDNGFVIVGNVAPYGGGGPFPVLLKTDASGNSLTLRNSLTGPAGLWNGVLEMPDGSLTITGGFVRQTAADLYLANLTPSGLETNWFNFFTDSGAFAEMGWDLLAIPEGGYVVGGLTTDNPQTYTGRRLWIFNTDCSGN